MTGTIKATKLAACVGVALVLSIFAGLQAASSALSKRLPETAAQLFSGNGDAYERIAFNKFTVAATDASALQANALAARPDALRALRVDPTLAKAYAILALAEGDVRKRNSAAIAASRINRRNLALQGLVLEAHLANDDYPATIETLDQIFRVHPTYSGNFYPLLGEAMRDPSTLPVFVDLLDGSSIWHQNFLTSYAIRQPDLLPKLAVLRQERGIENEQYDRDLIAFLARSGDWEVAKTLYNQLKIEYSQPSGGTQGHVSGTADWSSQFPPFDWRFSDEGDFRAQASRDGRELELFVRPGKGGVIAERILDAPAGPFELSLTQSQATSSEAEGARIELRCPGQSQPFFAEQLKAGANRILIPGTRECDQIVLVINARAFSGQTTLRSRLSQIEITKR